MLFDLKAVERWTVLTTKVNFLKVWAQRPKSVIMHSMCSKCSCHRGCLLQYPDGKGKSYGTESAYHLLRLYAEDCQQ